MRLVRSRLVVGAVVVAMGAAAPQPAAAVEPGAMARRPNERLWFGSLSSRLHSVVAWLNPFSAASNRPIATAVQSSSFRESRTWKLQRGSLGVQSDPRAQDGKKRRRHPASGSAARTERGPGRAEHAKNRYRWPAERARTATPPTPASAQGGRPVAAASEPLHRALQGLLGLSKRAEEALPADPRAAFYGYREGLTLLNTLLDVGPANALSDRLLNRLLNAAAKKDANNAADALSASALVSCLTDHPEVDSLLRDLRASWTGRMAVADQHARKQEPQPLRATATSLTASRAAPQEQATSPVPRPLGFLAHIFTTAPSPASAHAAALTH